MQIRKNEQPQQGQFLKALIKIANPDWTTEQIEAEYLRQQEQHDIDNGGCPMCSA